MLLAAYNTENSNDSRGYQCVSQFFHDNSFVMHLNCAEEDRREDVYRSGQLTGGIQFSFQRSTLSGRSLRERLRQRAIAPAIPFGAYTKGEV